MLPYSSRTAWPAEKVEGIAECWQPNMGMEIFSGEGLDPNFPLGGGVIFQPRGARGGLSYGILPPV